jgi:hypothetical protein
MSDATPTRIGQVAGAGDTRALFLKLFSGEVLTVYDAECVMKNHVRQRTISSGKSSQFPTFAGTVAEYHTPGAEITGNVIKHDEKVITIDDLLIAHTFVPRIDELMSHYEVRAEYSKRLGQALAQTYDRNLLSMAVKAARDPSGLGAGAEGQDDAEVINVGTSPTVDQLVAGFYSAAQKFDEKNIPAEGRVAIVSPAVYWAMVTSDKLVNRDYVRANGDYASGKMWEVAGIKIIKSNNLAVDHTSDTVDYGTKYQVDASDTAAVLLHGDALGTVKLMELATEAEWDIRRQGTLMVAKQAVGHGILRPEGIIEIRKHA